LGEVAADDNTLGVVGIAHSVASVRMVSHFDAGTSTNGHVADSITWPATEIPATDHYCFVGMIDRIKDVLRL
jgi:hypothetical protein